MDLSLWAKTSGTWINIATIVLGAGLGVLLRGRLPERMQRVIMQSLGLVTLFIGVSMAASLGKGGAGVVDGVILGLIALVVGGILGEWWLIEERLAGLGDWIKARVRGSGPFTEGFVAASLLFCIGPMALIGALNNGLSGDDKLLVIKAALDGLAAIALASSFGVGAGFSALVVLVYQGGVSLAAGGLANGLPDPAANPVVLLVSGVGGLMVMAVGINLLELTKIRLGSLLPALALAPLVWWIAA
ncbi:MAG TPA: DUF554 domain-containing protein, partial [Herpetosiphonaceae bacterium]|nr:DUF554 domain-containing protein [Herpetosiphonaceae bacterium]